MTNEFTNAEKERFLGLIQEFLEAVDKLAPTGKTTGSEPSKFESDMNEILQNLDYKSNFSFGQTYLAKTPFINFCPKKILSEDFVNGKTLSGKKGVYIGCGYNYGKQEIDLLLGYGKNDTKECKAKNKVDNYRDNGKWEFVYNRKDFAKIKEQIAKDFLYLVNEFNQIPLDDFKPFNSTNKEQTMPNSTNANKNSSKNLPLNQILYGPPGTGKTYSTINKALEILCNEKFAPAISDRDEILELLAKLKDNPSDKDARQKAKAKFDEYRQNGQIEFVTFHQSFSYEEFVEGIKPEIAQNSAQTSENLNSKELSYKIEAGIFKQICERALHKEYEILDKETNFQISDTTRVWKISIVAKSEKKLREKILEYCFKNDEIRIGWADYKTDEQVATLGANAQSSIEQFENASAGDMVCVFEGTRGIIRGVGIIDGEFSWDNDNADKDLQRYPRLRKLKWLDKNERDIYDLSGNLTLKTFYPLDRVKAVKLLDRMAKNTKLVVDNTQKPFILIIDEINRGNISKILGELITLIEPSKRIGATACVSAL